MPKHLIQQRRGKGGPTFRSPSHRGKAKVMYRSYDDLEKGSLLPGVVLDLISDPMHGAPLMLIQYGDGSSSYIPAPLGISVGSKVNCGVGANGNTGDVMKLKDIPEGTQIFNLEITPGDGGKLVRTVGVSARVVSREEGQVIIQLPSKKFKTLNPYCRATIGVIAGGGKKEKPFYKAGNKSKSRKARNKRYPRVKGTAMNAFEHPHGGGHRRKRKKYSVSRNAPPGAKVGSIAPSRGGLRKK